MYVQSHTLLFPDVFENYRNKCTELYELNPAPFFVCTRISMASLFKNAEAELELLTNIDMLLMVEKGIRG